jgi:DNA-binding transcriptional ArsR family regulator
MPKSKIIEEDGCRVRIIHADRIAKAKKDAIIEKDLRRLSLAYKALGDPTRLKMVMAMKGGEMCVCDLSVFIGLSPSAVSHQLRHLKDLALVKSRRDGQVLYYSLDDQHIVDFLNIGLDHIRE